MVDILEAGLVVGALGLDIYAYKKMKDAEAAAEDAVRNRERDRFKNAAGVSIEVTPQPAAAATTDTHSTAITTPTDGTADTHVQTSLTEHGMEHTTVHTDWKPVTYESVAPVQHTQEDEETEPLPEGQDAATAPTTLEMQTLTNQYDKINERLDVIDEKLVEQDTKISALDTQYDHTDRESQANAATLRTMNEQLHNIEIPAEQVEQIVNVKFAKTNEKLASQVKEQGKKLDAIEGKLDSHIIAAADPALIKRDLRDEFLPLLSQPKADLEAHAGENRKEFKALSVRITQARDAALAEAQSKASKAELKRVAATIKTDVQKVSTRLSARKTTAKAAVPKTKIAPKIVGTTVGKGTAKKAAAKSTKTTVVKTTKTTTVKTAQKPKSKIQSAVHEYAKSRKAKKAKPSKNGGNEVTVTTQVPKGTHVSTEVITGNQK